MKFFRQLGTCGTATLFGPLLWGGLCVGARALGQHAYEVNITPWTRQYRVAEAADAEFPLGGHRVTDPRVLTELDKYVKVWALEPGHCAEFPDAARMPFSWNPFHPSALMLRLKQKQAFLMTQHHQVRRHAAEGGRIRYLLMPDAEAALGGRHFVAMAKGNDLVEAFEF